jgi:hypothetical protein
MKNRNKYKKEKQIERNKKQIKIRDREIQRNIETD